MPKEEKQALRFRKRGSKYPGSVSTWWRKFQRAHHNGEVEVPCGACTACCRSPHLRVPLTPSEAERFGVTDKEKGHPTLAKNPDGSCIFLIDGRCSIYATRPHACKTYDCRTYMFLGISPGDDAVMCDAVQQWDSFGCKTADDRELATAARMAVAAQRPGNLDEAMAALPFVNRFRGRARELLRRYRALPKRERDQMHAEAVERREVVRLKTYEPVE